MSAKEIEVEGFKVIVEKFEGKYVVSVPKLPGCATQVDREEDAAREIRGMIGLYLAELASKPFTPHQTASKRERRGRSDGEPGP